VNYNSSIKDAAGNNLSSPWLTFTTVATPPDTTPPTVSITPLNGASGVGRNTAVVLAFSESLNPTTVDGSTISL